MDKNKKPFNANIRLSLPNLLSFYRMLAFPVILYFIISGKEKWFAILLVINLLTDVLDGLIARAFHCATEFGAWLDSTADDLTYLLAFTGIFVFKWEDFQPHAISFLIFIGFLVSTILFSLFRFKKIPRFHLYSTRISGYIQGIFFICLFTIGFIKPFYYFMIIWGILAAVEHIVIQLIIPAMRSNVKGLYWVLKENNHRKNTGS
ncbi:MAG: CDP-alcohol phosphatidyltransferase family protein [Bacteroidales bacterium]